MNKKSFIIAFIIIALTFLIYAYLGGYRTLEFKIEIQDMSIYGKTYEGPVKSDSLEILFNNAKEMAEKTNTRVAILDYPVKQEEFVKQFIGVISADSLSPKSIEFDEVTFIKTELTAHPAVMPLPEDVREDAAKFAAENDLTLDEYSIEVYSKDGSIEVYFPTKPY